MKHALFVALLSLPAAIASGQDPYAVAPQAYQKQFENDSVRVSWLEQYARLADSLGTPGEQGGRYLTDAEKEQVLSDWAMPSDAGLETARSAAD